MAWLLLLMFLMRRIRLEEAVLASEFKEKWAEYERGTRWRLLPGVY
jgi:protein-S-isoprenylcysteine O-methyltransferase Ste14